MTDRPTTKQPRIILQELGHPELDSANLDSRPATIFAFPPNRETLGGTAYLIVEEVSILVDCPPWNAENQAFLAAQGGVDWLVLTHRGGMAQVREIVAALQCPVLVQEQEAYLLPGVPVTTFGDRHRLSALSQVIWTPGHSPGSACVYCAALGGVLFSGRHLLPNPQGELGPLKTAKTFHWPRQLRSVAALQQEFTPDTLRGICPGGNIGFLRGRALVEPGYVQLASCVPEPNSV
jgi:glyoxylase-like metal-dependent hydrolase (beta-lactamase superfamily II)